MHWTEWGMIVLLIMLAIPVLILLFLLGTILWSLLTDWFQKRKTPKVAPPQMQTPFGVFIKADSVWESETEIEDRTFWIRAEDVFDEPNPAFLLSLPALLQDLPTLEQIARQKVETLTSEHLLEGISDGGDPGKFSLDFTCNEETWGETVNVWFLWNEITDWKQFPGYEITDWSSMD